MGEVIRLVKKLALIKRSFYVTIERTKEWKNALEKIAVKTELNDTTIMIIIF